MPSFVASSDWHVGARLGTAGRAARRFREVRYETFRRVVEAAADAAALFLLGDTFDADTVGAEDVQRTAALLAEATCPVHVLPGNHDWWHPGGVIQAFERATAKLPNVHVVHAEATPLRLEGVEGVTFYPCPLFKHAGVADPTLWIPARADADGVRVGLIHGALDFADWGGHVPGRVAEERDLDLALLGDWHSPYDGPDGKSFYCGSPEPKSFTEEHAGQVVRVRLEGGAPEVERVRVGRLAWRRIELDLEPTDIGGEGLGALDAALAALGVEEQEDAVLRVRLHGHLGLDELQLLDQRADALREGGWAHCEVVSDVELAGDVDLDDFEEESIRAVAQRIWESDADSIVRRRALAILRDRVEATR